LTVFAIFIAAFAPMLLNTVKGVTTIDKINLKVAYTHNASKSDLVLKVLIPAIEPIIIVSVRIGLGLAWLALVTAEMVGAEAGIAERVCCAPHRASAVPSWRSTPRVIRPRDL
jgi:ABC-type nitrate/sulfonate/bicarbonate transport system permease component